MKLSIVTVCYNSVKTIEQTIRSVLSQNNGSYEYIIIDGGSDDGTLDVIKRYEDNIAYFISEPDKGLYDAMNKGVLAASGDIISFLNSDDWYFEYTVNRVLQEFKYGDYDIVYGDIFFIKDGFPPICQKSEIVDIYNNPPNHQIVFARTDLFAKIGMYDLQYPLAACFDWLLKAYVAGYKFQYIPLPLTNYRLDGLSSREAKQNVKEAKCIAIKHLTEAKAEEYLPIINELYEKKAKRVLVVNEFRRLFERDYETLIRLLSDYIKPGEIIYIWGSGIMGCQCWEWCKAIGADVKAIIDSDPLKRQGAANGIEVCGVEILRKERHRIIVTPIKHEDDISQRLEGWNYQKQTDYVLFSEMVGCIYEHALANGNRN
jgi:glycosyltransferase involved in cell wall biosynthesis